MKQTNKSRPAFTIVELLIVIIVIGILASLGIYSFAQVQTNARDAKRASSISSIAEALENYYKKNGEYPSCSMMSQSAENVASSVLSKDITKDVLTTPKAAAGTNSIQAACADLNASSGDLFSYIGDTDPNCTTGSACSKYVLKYIEEGTGNVITVKSRYGNEESFAVTWGGTSNDHAMSVAQTSDGGYVITGTQYSFSIGGTDSFIAKYDIDGNLVWSRTWGSTGYDGSESVIQTKDGGFLVAGYVVNSGNMNALIIKFNFNGEVEWSRILNEAATSSISKVIQTSDGGYAITGISEAYSTYGFDVLTAKYDKDGNLLWIRALGGLDYDRGESIAELANGDLVVAGLTNSFGAGPYEAILIKYSSNGNFIWNKTWGGSGDDKAHEVIASNEGYTIVGETTSFGNGNIDTFITRFDKNGILQWSRTWGGTAADYLYGAILTDSNNSVLIAGDTLSFAIDSDAFVAKFDISGNLTWSKTWSGNTTDRHYAISPTQDGGFVATGNVYSYGAGGGDALLIKYKPNGSISNCPETNCKNRLVTVTSPNASVSSPATYKKSPAARTDNYSVTITSTNLPISKKIH